MSLNNLSYSDLQRRLDDPQQRDELVQLAREARPGRAARGGLLTREQRAWLHCNVATKKAAVSEHVAKQPLLASPAGSIVSPSPAPVCETRRKLFSSDDAYETPGKSSKTSEKDASASSHSRPRGTSWHSFTSRTQTQKKAELKDLVAQSCATAEEAADSNNVASAITW